MQHEDVITDKLRLNQILINIVGNAIKFTPVGGDIIIHLVERPCSTSGYAAYEFSIKDTGIGMSSDFLGHAFDTFAREQSATVSGIQGTGLGMAITKNIVEMMGGTVEVESEEGKGSKFTVTLTLRLADKPIRYAPIAELQGARAHVVDDDIETCRSVCKMLRSFDMQPDLTVTGIEAVLRAQDAAELKDEYKVYIVDYLMPDMNGIETIRRIRRVIHEDVPIIVLTAYDWADFEKEAREAGATAFVAKPLFMSELRSVRTKPVQMEEPKPEETEKTFDYSGKRVLLVEDNALNRELALAILGESGMQIDCAEDGIEAGKQINEAPEDRYELVLMDIRLPFYNGYYWCTEIRKVSKVPVIFLSSVADNMNIVMAMNMGGDDFIPKPFDLEVLTAKIQALLRRSYDFTGTSSMLEHKGAVLNLLNATLTWNGGQIELTKNELKILQTLMEHKEKIVSREELMEKLWESDAYVDENTLSVNVNRLRKKLSSVGLDDFILTKKGIGYRIG